MPPIIDAMDFVGAWLRQLLRAGTAAALVPIAMVASLAVVLAGAGGLGGLGSLGQIVTGPAISPAQREVAAIGTAPKGELAIVAPPTIAAAPRPAAQPQRRAPSAPPAPQRTVSPPGQVVPPAPAPAVVTPPPAPVPVAPPAGAAAPPPPAPKTAKQKTQAVVQQLGDTVHSVVVIVGNVITVNGLLGGPPPR
jgi:hypothetical protein